MEKGTVVNNTENQSEEISLQKVFAILYKRLLWIILCTVIFALGGLGLAFLRDKPVYTAEKSVMFVTNITASGGTSTDVSLAKMVLPDATELIKTDKVVKNANSKYSDYVSAKGITGATRISAKNISTSYGDKSLIMKICYSDLSEENASVKLDKVIESAKEELPGKLPANVVQLVPVQSSAKITVQNAFYKYILFAGLIGLFLSVCVVLAIEMMDSTVKNRDQLESLTGATVLASIADVKILGDK